MKTPVSPKVIYPELSYKINGLLFEVHNTLGRYAKEKQYADALESLLKKEKVQFQREHILPVALIANQATNRADFLIDGKIVLELKAKPIITKEDYYQLQRYLHAAGFGLGLIVNFRNQYLKPIRIIRSNS